MVTVELIVSLVVAVLAALGRICRVTCVDVDQDQHIDHVYFDVELRDSSNEE